MRQDKMFKMFGDEKPRLELDLFMCGMSQPITFQNVTAYNLREEKPFVRLSVTKKITIQCNTGISEIKEITEDVTMSKRAFAGIVERWSD